MIYTDKTKKAMLIMFEKHKNQLDKGNLPYVNHPLHVAESMDDEISTCAALLHDVVEDTDTSFDELLQEGIDAKTVDVLRVLKHQKNQDYYEYIYNLSMNIIAVKVKIADLIHNSDLTRLQDVSKKDLKRVDKYKICLLFLSHQLCLLKANELDLAQQNAMEFLEKHKNNKTI